jgi:hypothetical protein
MANKRRCRHDDRTWERVTFRNGTQHMQERCRDCSKYFGYVPKHRWQNMPIWIEFGEGTTKRAKREEVRRIAGTFRGAP